MTNIRIHTTNIRVHMTNIRVHTTNIGVRTTNIRLYITNIRVPGEQGWAIRKIFSFSYEEHVQSTVYQRKQPWKSPGNEVAM